MNAPTIVPNVRCLSTLEPKGDEAEIFVRGYRRSGDGGGGEFYWDPMSDEAEDGGTIFRVQGVPLGRWKRRTEGNDGVVLLNLAWFGATGTGSEEDGQALANATRAAVRMSAHRATALFLPQGRYGPPKQREAARLRVV